MPSSETKLTKRTVDAAEIPKKGEPDNRIWDAEIPGFCLRVYSTGRKVYSVKYRVGATQRWFTIGEHGKPWKDTKDQIGDLTADRARDEAQRVVADAKRGNDHQAVKFERRRDITVSALIDLYLDEKEGGPSAKPNKRAASWAQDRSSLNRHVRPLIGRKIARDLRPADVTKMAKDIAEGATATNEKTGKRGGRAIVRGGPTVATRTVATVSAMFAWAMKHGGLVLPANPAAGAGDSLGRRPAKERFLSVEESLSVFATLDEMEADKTLNPKHADALRLLLLTGARKTEIAGLKWAEVDLARSRLVLPPERTKAGEKTGERRIALGVAARDILTKRAGSNEVYVFPAHRGDGHIVGLQKSWENVRARAKLPGVRIHDLRHSFASFAIAGGASLFMVGKALGHADTRVTERYSHIHGDALDGLAEAVGRRMRGEVDKPADAEE